MSTPVPGSRLSPTAATNTTTLLLAFTTLASPMLAASSRENMTAAAGLGLVLVLMLVYCLYWKKRRMRLSAASPSITLNSGKRNFTLDEVRESTGGFSQDNVLGEGGFGRVYRGVLPDREEVAVKRLEVGRGQGEREFLTEVEIISRVHHKHVVSLVGYCTTMSERILVFDYVPNGSLKSHLHGEGRPTLGWTARMKIAVGSAKGLQYLHEDCHPTIIHRDIKAANILVNFDFEAKIVDFGFAKYASESNNGESRLVGTIGYFAPEYASSGELTPNADTFSFGVVLLELITGRRPVGSPHNSSNYNLAFSMRPHLTQALQDGNFDFLVDPRLQNNYDPSEMTRMVACAAACVRESAQHRPRMSLVARVLEGYQSAADLDDGTGAGPSTFDLKDGSSRSLEEP